MPLAGVPLPRLIQPALGAQTMPEQTYSPVSTPSTADGRQFKPPTLPLQAKAFAGSAVESAKAWSVVRRARKKARERGRFMARDRLELAAQLATLLLKAIIP